MHPVVYKVESYQRGAGLDGVQISGQSNNGSFEFYFSADPDSCHNGYCFTTALDTYTVGKNAWNYLGNIKASGVGGDGGPLKHVFFIAIDGVKIYFASSVDPRTGTQQGIEEVLKTFIFTAK